MDERCDVRGERWEVGIAFVVDNCVVHIIFLIIRIFTQSDVDFVIIFIMVSIIAKMAKYPILSDCANNEEKITAKIFKQINLSIFCRKKLLSYIGFNSF